MRLVVLGLGLLVGVWAAAPSIPAMAETGMAWVVKAYPIGLQPQPDGCEKLPEWKAAASDDMDAAVNAGAALEFGYCGQADPAAAIPYYEHAAQVQNYAAMVRLGAIFLHRRGGTNDQQRADREFRSAIAALYVPGDWHAQLLPSWTGRFVQEFGLTASDIPGQEAFILTLFYLEHGDVKALAALRSAFAWREAVANGPAHLKHHWGLRLRAGEGIRRFPARSAWLLYEAEKQNPEGLQIAYDLAHGVINDLHEMDDETLDQMTAMLGEAFSDDRSTEEARRSDLLLGFRMLQGAAAKGYVPAQLDLGLWMADGLNGLKQDMPGGYQWLFLAKQSGLPIGDWVDRVGAQLNQDARADLEARAQRGELAGPELADAPAR